MIQVEIMLMNRYYPTLGGQCEKHALSRSKMMRQNTYQKKR
jgi:hypothetical protein